MSTTAFHSQSERKRRTEHDSFDERPTFPNEFSTSETRLSTVDTTEITEHKTGELKWDDGCSQTHSFQP